MPSRWRGRSSGRTARRPLDHLVHLRLVGAQRAADRDAVALAGGDRLRGLDAQVLVDAALHDAVDELSLRPVLVVPVQAAAQPAVRALGRAGRVLALDVERGALVEDQREIGAQRGLDLHRRLGRHPLLRAVEVGAEAHAVLLDREDAALALAARRRAALDLVGHRAVAHREDLEAAGVGHDRLPPAHELVQAAEALDPLVAGVEEEVERVAQHHVVAQRGHLGREQALDRRLRRQRHERGRAHLAVGGREHPGAGAGGRRRGRDRQGRHREHARSGVCSPAFSTSPRTSATRSSSC